MASANRVRSLMNELGVQPVKLEDHDDSEESKLFQHRSYLLLSLLNFSILINYDEDCHLLTGVSVQRGRHPNQQSQHIPWTNGISAHSAPTPDVGGGGASVACLSNTSLQINFLPSCPEALLGQFRRVVVFYVD